jgi:hypothetical protein
MKDFILTMLRSKKFITAIVTILLLVLQYYGLELPIEVAMAFVSPLITYIIGQGIADNGKEKAKVENGN